jgi:hypothetical protein
MENQETLREIQTLGLPECERNATSGALYENTETNSAPLLIM